MSINLTVQVVMDNFLCIEDISEYDLQYKLLWITSYVLKILVSMIL